MTARNRTSLRSQSPSAEFLAGARDQIPILLGVAPFGLIFGALALISGIPPLEAQGFSLFVFAGSAQFIAAGLIAEAASPLLVMFTILVVNLRHMLYSASMAPHLRPLPARWKIALSWLLTDEAFAVTSVRYRKSDREHAHWYFLGTGLTLWIVWQVSTALGIALSASVPESWSLDFALPLTFMALLTPFLADRPSWGAALCAGLLSLALVGLPYRLNLLIGASAGVAVGLLLERWWPPALEGASS
ncbi:MAG: AzlC family ABC transporter permease [Anaerolineales bacterium]|jgi:4-azaleucine resistance transporter AzlC